MAITTLATFIDALEAMTVTGVTRVFQGPPAALNASDLPAMWVQLPKSDEGPMTFEFGGGWPTLTADLCIAVEAAAQDRQSANFAAMVTAFDNLATALRSLSVGKSPLSWGLRTAGLNVAGVAYWGIIATVTGKG